MLTLGSLFDGIGGWLLAAERAGIEPIWASEIDPFPQAVTNYHFQNVKQLGDITKLDGASIAPVDIVTMGSPCQDLSIAGKKEGLHGERSGLFIRAVELIRAMRRATGGRKPRFVIWENVPGAFSSNRGLDFKTVLEKITEEDIPIPTDAPPRWTKAGMVQCRKCDVAWRVLDAQFFGVPSAAVVSSLSQILQKEDDVPKKYYLSRKACRGILRRKRMRKKELPPELRRVLVIQARWGILGKQEHYGRKKEGISRLS